MSKASVLNGVGGVVTDQVVVRNSMLSTHDAGCEIVVVKERLTSRVRSQRVQSILRLLEAIVICLLRCTVIHARIAGRSLRCITERNESAGINGPERNACAYGGINRSMKLRLIVISIQTETT